MKCINCGFNMPEGIQYCSKCGSYNFIKKDNVDRFANTKSEANESAGVQGLSESILNDNKYSFDKTYNLLGDHEIKDTHQILSTHEVSTDAHQITKNHEINNLNNSQQSENNHGKMGIISNNNVHQGASSNNNYGQIGVASDRNISGAFVNNISYEDIVTKKEQKKRFGAAVLIVTVVFMIIMKACSIGINEFEKYMINSDNAMNPIRLIDAEAMGNYQKYLDYQITPENGVIISSTDLVNKYGCYGYSSEENAMIYFDVFCNVESGSYCDIASKLTYQFDNDHEQKKYSMEEFSYIDECVYQNEFFMPGNSESKFVAIFEGEPGWKELTISVEDNIAWKIYREDLEEFSGASGNNFTHYDKLTSDSGAVQSTSKFDITFDGYECVRIDDAGGYYMDEDDNFVGIPRRHETLVYFYMALENTYPMTMTSNDFQQFLYLYEDDIYTVKKPLDEEETKNGYTNILNIGNIMHGEKVNIFVCYSIFDDTKYASLINAFPDTDPFVADVSTPCEFTNVSNLQAYYDSIGWFYDEYEVAYENVPYVERTEPDYLVKHGELKVGDVGNDDGVYVGLQRIYSGNTIVNINSGSFGAFPKDGKEYFFIAPMFHIYNAKGYPITLNDENDLITCCVDGEEVARSDMRQYMYEENGYDDINFKSVVIPDNTSYIYAPIFPIAYDSNEIELRFDDNIVWKLTLDDMNSDAYKFAPMYAGNISGDNKYVERPEMDLDMYCCEYDVYSSEKVKGLSSDKILIDVYFEITNTSQVSKNPVDCMDGIVSLDGYVAPFYEWKGDREFTLAENSVYKCGNIMPGETVIITCTYIVPARTKEFRVDLFEKGGDQLYTNVFVHNK